MAVTLDDKLVVAISSRALFDFEEENRIFDPLDPRAYMELQQARLEVPAKPGVAFQLVRKLLAFNTPQARRVEVVILSRNDPVSALRIFAQPKKPGCRWSAACSQGATPSATCGRWARTCFCRPTSKM